MNIVKDLATIARLREPQRGVFSAADLQTALAERHRSAMTRRLKGLVERGALQRFIRGWYLTATFDAPTLCARLSPTATLSFDTVLAQAGFIEERPPNQWLTTRVGPTRRYEGAGIVVEQLSIAAHLDFGFEVIDGVRWALPEKAVLDTLYFHLRGRRFTFDIYSDVAYHRLDRGRLEEFLSHYRNPKFGAFVHNVLEAA
jgi:hypothetical protein